METNHFIEKFAEALELEHVESLNENTNFRTLPEWDSLAYLSVIAMIDEEYNCQIETAEFKKLNTIGDIITFISNN